MTYQQPAKKWNGRDPQKADYEAAAWYAFKTLPRRVGAFIPCTRPERLASAIDSLLAQTHPLARIVVVDDSENYNTFVEDVCSLKGVEYCRLERERDGRCAPVKAKGFELLADLPYAFHVDDDDYIPPHYVERLLDAMESDCRAAVAFPRLVQFGDQCKTVQGDPANIDRCNFAPSTSLIRMDALAQIGGWPADLPAACHDDWATWRRFRDLGWTFARADTEYFWRRHTDSRTGQHAGRANADFAWRSAADPHGLVTIAVPVCRWQLFGEWLRSIAHYQVSALELFGQCDLLVLDNSGSAAVREAVADLLCRSLNTFRSVTICENGTPAEGETALASNAAVADAPRLDHADEVNHRVAGNWNQIARLITTPLAWLLEDDVFPPPGALQRLLAKMTTNIDAVTGAYPLRTGGWNAKRCAMDRTVMTMYRQTGSEPCDLAGFGCCLIRREVLQSTVSRSAGDGEQGHKWFDWNFWSDFRRQGYRLIVDWDVVCEHRLAAAQPEEEPQIAAVC